jgi:iron complex outermembrane receptor protein
MKANLSGIELPFGPVIARGGTDGQRRATWRLAAGMFLLAFGSALAGASADAATAAIDATDTPTAARSAVVEEVLVTARRREESASDVPLSVSVVSGDRLTEERLDRVADYAFKLPNFYALQQNTRVSSLTVRGLGGNANSDGSESGVGLIVDNVFLTHVGFSWLDFVDLESIELVRGPQGTLLGKNTTIGALIVTTKKPSFEPEASLSTTLGNYDRTQVRGNFSGPIIDDRLAYRVTVAGDRSDGWVDNAYNDDEFLDTDRYSLRGQLLYEGDSSSNRFIAERFRSKEYNNFYPPDDDITQFVNGAPRPAAWSNKLRDRFGYDPSFDHPDNANLDTQDELTAAVSGLSNEFNLEIGDHTLTSVTAWRTLFFRPKNDSDNAPFPISRAGFDVDVDQYSQEFRLASPGGETFDYTVGLYYLHEDVDSTLRYKFYEDASRFFVTAATPSVVLDGVEYDQAGETEVDSAAVFGQTTWNATDAFALTLGLRYTQEDRSASNTGLAFGGAELTDPALIATRNAVVNAFGGVFVVEDDVSEGAVSWLVNPSYRINDDVLLYGSVSYGEKSGAANLTATPGRPVIIEPEESIHYEVGVKSSFWNGLASVNANLYWNDIDDYQAAQVDPERRNIGSYLGNVGKVRLRGVELEASVAPVEGLSLSLAGAYNDATYESYDNAPPPLEYAYPGAPATLSLTGEQINNAPKWSGQVSVNYERPLVGEWWGFGYVNTRYRDETTFINPLSEYGREDAYTVTNAGLGVRDARGRYTVTFWSKNLFDEEYNLAYGAAGTGPVIAIMGEPRTYGATFSWNLL